MKTTMQRRIRISSSPRAAIILRSITPMLMLGLAKLNRMLYLMKSCAKPSQVKFLPHNAKAWRMFPHHKIPSCPLFWQISFPSFLSCPKVRRESLNKQFIPRAFLPSFLGGLTRSFAWSVGRWARSLGERVESPDGADATSDNPIVERFIDGNHFQNLISLRGSDKVLI